MHAPSEDRQVFVAPYGRSGDWQRVTETGGWSDKPHWSADGKELYFYSLADGFQCVWSRSFDRVTGGVIGPLRQVHHFHNTRLSSLHISEAVMGFAVDGNKLYLNLAENSASIWMSLK